MLQLLEKECRVRNIPTHMLTGQTKDPVQSIADFQRKTPVPGVFFGEACAPPAQA